MADEIETDEYMAFQPTRPLRGATVIKGGQLTPVDISTHAPLAGRDLAAGHNLRNVPVFQPTRPLRGATLVELIQLSLE